MLKLFKKLKYTTLSKIIERKLRRKYGCNVSIKLNEYAIREKNDKVKTKIKVEITSYEKDCKKLLDNLLTKGH